MSNGRMVNSRIPVTEETRDKVRDFVYGLGASYETAILFLLEKVKISPDEEDFMAGRRLRETFKAEFEDDSE